MRYSSRVTRYGLCLWGLLAIAARTECDEAAALIPLLRTDQARHAAEQLADLGADARSAVPALQEALRSGDTEIQWRAAWALARIGPDAAPAAADLLRVAAGRGLTATAASVAVARIGRGATGALVGRLQTATPEERRLCFSFMKEIKPDPDVAVPLLVQFVERADGPDPDACAVLESMQGDAAAAVPALIAALRARQGKPFKPDVATESDILDALVSIGEPSVSALADLTRSGATSLNLRGDAVGALLRIGGSGLAPARDCLGVTPEFSVLFDIVSGAVHAGARAAPLAADLARVIEGAEDPPALSARALLALGEAGAKELERILFDGRPDASANLIRQLNHSDDTHLPVSWVLRLAKPKLPAAVRQEALAALARAPLADAETREAVKLAEQALKENHTRVVSEACRLVGHVRAVSLSGRLKPLLKHPSGHVRAAAASALCELGKGGPKEARAITSVIEEAAKAEDWRLQWYAVECLASAGQAAASEHRVLLDVFKGDNDSLRQVAAKGLGRMFPSVGDARAVVFATLRDAGHFERRSFARGLAEVADTAALMSLLTDDDADEVALDGLVINGGKAWKVLIAALDDTNPRVRRLAALAMLRIDVEKAGPRACLIALGDHPVEYTDAKTFRALKPVPTATLRIGLTSDNETTRARAAAMLGDLGDSDALAQLWKMAKDDPAERVRTSALRSVDCLLQAQGGG